MNRFELANIRIAERERELARAQFELTPALIDAALMREALDRALTMARTAIMALDRIGDSFDESVGQMARELNIRD